MATEPIIIDDEFVKPYFSGEKKHKNYWKALDYYLHMSFHFDGYFFKVPSQAEMADFGKADMFQVNQQENNTYFKRLIDLRRPSESSDIQTYRRNIYLPLTKAPCFKVYNSLRKIIKASDWKIDYTKATKPSGIADGEYLEDYCEEKYPHFNSVENWWYNYGMRHMLVDANAVIYVLPETFELSSEYDYYKPIATIVHSKHVLDFKDDEYCIFEMEDRDWEYMSGKTMRKGKCLGIITKEGFWEARQVSDKMKFDLVQISEFQMRYLPAFQIGGVPKKFNSSYTLYESFMSPMLPGLDALARESSDADAEVVQHVYSIMWRYAEQDCRACMGRGWVNPKGKQVVTCSECNGTGGAPKSPYREAVYKAGSLDESKIPTPPMGYVEKNQDIVKLFQERLDNHEYQALSAINHEFLAESPIVQSGVSKQFDRQELENYTYSVAYHCVENVLDDVYFFINEWRYMNLVTNPIKRDEMLPTIAIPTKYDLLTEAIIEQQMQTAQTAKVDPEIFNKMEEEYVQKKFPNDHFLRDRMKVKNLLDPFPNMTTQEKQDAILAKTVLRTDVIISLYLHQFIERAIKENPEVNGEGGFMAMEYDEQVAIMEEYASEKDKDMSAAEKIKQQANNPPIITDPNDPNYDATKDPNSPQYVPPVSAPGKKPPLPPKGKK